MQDKKQIRERGRRERDSLSDETRSDYDHRIVARCRDEFDRADYRSVMVFLPIERHHEINTWPLVHWLWDLRPEIKVYAPVASGGRLEARQITRKTVLNQNKWGAAEPADGSELGVDGKLDLILTPLLGFDLAGHRVGYGGGYYDRFFADHLHTRRIGLAYECLLVAGGISAEAHDVKLRAVITERRVYEF